MNSSALLIESFAIMFYEIHICIFLILCNQVIGHIFCLAMVAELQRSQFLTRFQELLKDHRCNKAKQKLVCMYVMKNIELSKA